MDYEEIEVRDMQSTTDLSDNQTKIKIQEPKRKRGEQRKHKRDTKVNKRETEEKKGSEIVYQNQYLVITIF